MIYIEFYLQILLYLLSELQICYLSCIICLSYLFQHLIGITLSLRLTWCNFFFSNILFYYIRILNVSTFAKNPWCRGAFKRITTGRTLRFSHVFLRSRKIFFPDPWAYGSGTLCGSNYDNRYRDIGPVTSTAYLWTIKNHQVTEIENLHWNVSKILSLQTYHT